MGKIKTTPQGKNIKAGQRVNRGQAEMADGGSSLSSTGMDRAQFGAGSGAGDMADAIQTGNEQQLQALGSVGNKLETVNGSLADLNKNMETLKKLEGATLLFEFTKFREFGDTFDGMEKVFKQQEEISGRAKKSMDANADEMIARNEAGFRSIVKAITRLHSFFAGDTKQERAMRMEANSADHSEDIMKHRSIRNRQRAVFKKHEIYDISDTSDHDVKMDFWKASREAGALHSEKRKKAKKGGEEKLKAVNAEIYQSEDYAALLEENEGDIPSDVFEKFKKKYLLEKFKDDPDLERQIPHAFNRDLIKETTFGRETAHIGGNNYAPELNDDNEIAMILLLEQIELNTHVFSDIKKGLTKAFGNTRQFKSNLQAREDNLEADKAKADDETDEKIGGRSSLKSLKNHFGFGGTGGNIDAATISGGKYKAVQHTIEKGGNTIIPAVWGKPGILKRLKKYLKIGGKVFAPVAIAFMVDEIYDRIQSGEPFVQAMANTVINFATFGVFSQAFGATAEDKAEVAAAIDLEKDNLVTVQTANGPVVMSIDDARKYKLKQNQQGSGVKTYYVPGGRADIDSIINNTNLSLIRAQKEKKIAQEDARYAAELAAAANSNGGGSVVDASTTSGDTISIQNYNTTGDATRNNADYIP